MMMMVVVRPVLHSCLLTLAFGSPTYDYVIAGGGTAGLLLAVALTQNASVTVAVLEAGDDGRHDPRITVPENEGLIQNTKRDWQFHMVPQLGLDGHPMSKVNKGKVLGGTSAMNYMIWNRASRVEYNAWEEILGNTGWNWTTILEANKAAEHFLPPSNNVLLVKYDEALHGTSGPIYTTFQRDTFTLYSDYLVPTLQNLKVRLPDDKEDPNTTGAGPVPLAINRNSYTRSYSGSAYTVADQRPNLHVFVDSTVTEIAWGAPTSKGLQTATGVIYHNNTSGDTTVLNGRKVILSAGSIQTPQLLELSGIGDPAVLSPLDIQQRVDLPAVGTGLQDKLTYAAGSFSFNKTGFTDTKYVQTFLDYAQATRLLSPADQTMFANLVDAAKPSSTISQSAISMLKQMISTDQPLIEFGWFYGYVNIYLLHPLSTGTVHVNTTNPLLQPVINGNYNTAKVNGTSIDLWLLGKAASYLTKVLATAPPFSDIGAKFSISNRLSDSEIQDHVFRKLGFGQHWTGGAVMLPRHEGGVVDTDLLVYGTSNVRVVDASVIPAVPGQHPMSLAYAIAMRAAGILSGAA